MNKKCNERYAVVTGASQGLGKAFALELAKLQMNVILVSLPGQNLQRLSNEIEEKYDVKVKYYETDFSLDKNILKLASWLNNNFEIDILINNAGIGGTRRFEDVNITYIDTIIQVNVKATSILTHQLLANLKRQSNSYILNVSSMAGLSPIGYKTVYPASKAFIHSFSIGLYEELKDTNVSISVINPGAMATNEEVTSRIKSQGFWGKVTLRKPSKIAHYSVKRLLKRDRIIIVNPLAWIVSNILPVWIKLPIMTKIIKREIHNENNICYRS